MAATLLALTGLASSSDFASVPVVDLRDADDNVQSTILAALRQYGFFYVRNHGVKDDLVQQQFEGYRGESGQAAEEQPILEANSSSFWRPVGWPTSTGQLFQTLLGTRGP